MPSDPRERQAFLARIRAGLGHEAARIPAPLDLARDNEALVRLEVRSPEMKARFLQRAQAVGMTPHLTTTTGVAPLLRGLSTQLPFHRPAVSIDDPALRQLVGDGTINWRDATGLDALYDADAGITGVFAAIAETGTLVVRSTPSTTRGGFLVPPIHVALVRASLVLPDMVDLWPLLQPIPTSVVLITGPSKTADIEGILITGVHGPKEVHVVLIEDS